MTDNPAEVVESVEPRRAPRHWRRMVLVLAITLLLFGVPWWTLLAPSASWPTAVFVVGTLLFAAAFAAMPALMVLRPWPPTSRLGRRDRRHTARRGVGDVRLVAAGSAIAPGPADRGVEDPVRSRLVAGAVLGVVAILLAWGYAEAMRVPRVKKVDVAIARLGPGMDGLRVAVITDTHYGPINRARWSAAVVARVNELGADLVCHVGDIADGTVEVRELQATPLASVNATLSRVYVTGNHEYFSEAEGWLDYMESIGWAALHNLHMIVERGGDRLVVAGVDDATAQSSGVRGHRADLEAALAGSDATLPILLLAHQPKQVAHAVLAGVDLQISGHTHGGQIWPFNFLVRLEQPVVHGLSRHGDRTQLYTSRGTGFWGPPFRVFAPSEITLLTLRSPSSSGAPPQRG